MQFTLFPQSENSKGLSKLLEKPQYSRDELTKLHNFFLNDNMMLETPITELIEKGLRFISATAQEPELREHRENTKTDEELQTTIKQIETAFKTFIEHIDKIKSGADKQVYLSILKYMRLFIANRMQEMKDSQDHIYPIYEESEFLKSFLDSKVNDVVYLGNK